jgi:hypothetical protein
MSPIISSEDSWLRQVKKQDWRKDGGVENCHVKGSEQNL